MVPVHGCNFHWKQAVFRKVADLGLRPTYERSGSVREVIKRLMALPFLPEEHIRAAFGKLRLSATTPLLIELFNYVEQTWFQSSTWTVASWTCFMKPIRTNNDCEGWHRGLNDIVRNGAPPFYLTVQHLHSVTKYTNLYTRLVSCGKLVRRQRKQYKQVQGKIFSLWEKYNSRDITTNHLLSAISHLVVDV